MCIRDRALIDLDDFKRLNDTLGHHAGDEALVHLVKGLRAALRPSDILCRFGGEEFVLLLPETGLGEAAAAIARFQPVSYTHLDVYKRQIVHWEARIPAGAGTSPPSSA